MRSQRVPNLAARRLAAWLFIGLLVFLAVPVSGQEPTAGAAAATTTIAMGDSFFEPQLALVVVNTTVKWTNTGSFAHDVTSADDAFADSPRDMPGGASHEVKFDKPGVYDYRCTIHSAAIGQAMWGRLVVSNEPLLKAAGDGGVAPQKVGVRWLAHWVGIVSFVAVVVTLVLYYFVLKFGETVHATDHRDRKEK